MYLIFFIFFRRSISAVWILIQRPIACLVARISPSQAGGMQFIGVWLPAPRLGAGPDGARGPQRPGSRETKSNRVSPQHGSRGRLLPLVVTRHGVAVLEYSPNQTASRGFLALQPHAGKQQNLHGVSLAPGACIRDARQTEGRREPNIL
jgi:hypothetical protein